MPDAPQFADNPDPTGPPMRVGSLCTGCGGLDVAVHAVLGAQLMFTTEPDRHPRHPAPSRAILVLPTGVQPRRHHPGGRLHDLCTDLDGNLATTHTGLWFDAARDDRALPPRRLVTDNVAAIDRRPAARTCARRAGQAG